jgi:hypothetical protein
VAIVLRCKLECPVRFRLRQKNPKDSAIAAKAPIPTPRPIASFDVPVTDALLAAVLGVLDIAFVWRGAAVLGEIDAVSEADIGDGTIVPTGNAEP